MTTAEESSQKLKAKKELIETRKKRIKEILYETIPSSIVNLDKNFQILDCNKIFVDSVGYSKDEIIGKFGFDFINEKDKEMILANVDEIKKGKIVRHDLYIKRKDGSIFHALWNTIPIFDENKNYDGHFSIGFDLNEIDKLREELIEKEKLLISTKLKDARRQKITEILYETIPNPVITFDQNNKLVDCNQYFLDKMGFSKDEIIGMYAPDFLSEKDKKTYRDVIQPSLVAGKQLIDIDLYIKKKNGSLFHSLWNHIRISSNTNEYLGFTAIGLDLTEIDKLREEIIKKEKMAVLGSFSSRLAHDLRNPLSIIMMSLENLKMMYGMDDTKQRQFDKIKRSIDRMTHQVDDVLNFVKERPLTFTETKTSKIISESLNSLVIPDTIKLILPENDVKLVCDKKQLAIALNNLVLNGIQAIVGSGTIIISVEENNDEIVIRVEDSGEPIPKEDLDHIFEPLFTTKQHGTGLGLVSAKSIIESHGGTISVTSPPVIFTITLPKTLD